MVIHLQPKRLPRCRVPLIDVAKAMKAMREDRLYVERQTGTVCAECWLCFDAVWGDSVEDAYAKLTKHIQVRHPEEVKP